MPCSTVVLCGISSLFRLLSPCLGQIVHALLTRPPLASDRSPPPARLACVKHAASVRPEPGSNSDVQSSSVSQAATLENGDSLIFESDCLFFLFLSVSFSRICCVVSLTTLMIIRYSDPFVNTFFRVFSKFFSPAFSPIIYNWK